MSEKRNYGFDTLQVQAGQVPDPAIGARAVPISQTTAFALKDFAAAQGIEPLSFRVERRVRDAQEVADYLSGHPQIEWVNYPGLKSNPYYELGKKYLPKGAGSILTFGIKGGFERFKRFIESLELSSFLANVGDSKSLVGHPATVTHGQLSEAEQRAARVKPEQIRLSLGVEDLEDLFWNLGQAFDEAQA